MTNSRSAKGCNKLSDLKIRRLKEPGLHSDGNNLYLAVDPSGAKRWVFKYRWKQSGVNGAGRPREMGLGSFNKVSLQKAREKAAQALELLGEGEEAVFPVISGTFLSFHKRLKSLEESCANWPVIAPSFHSGGDLVVTGGTALWRLKVGR